MAAAHAAAVGWCDANGHVRTGVRWEVYEAGTYRGEVTVTGSGSSFTVNGTGNTNITGGINTGTGGVFVMNV